MKPTLVVVGASYAGTQLAASVRERGFDGRIVLLGDEPDAPYQRPPLSKGFLLADGYEQERLALRSAAFFDEARIELRPSTRALRIDRSNRKIELHDGTCLAYDHLALATGARVRKLDCPGATLSGVHYLRDLGDARHLAVAARTARRVVVVGGGYIGLEVAASLRQRGAQVTVVETQARLLARVAPPFIADFIQRTHLDRGVSFELGRKVVALHGAAGHVAAVELDGGQQLTCDLVVVGIGVVPNIELAADCGLAVSGGISVDAYARTSDPAIVAVGDCASFVSHFSPPGSPPSRIESVQNAIDMAKAAAASIVGEPQPYRALPWFWSDQYDIKLQMAGISADSTDCIVRGSVTDRKFSLYYFRDGLLVAVDSVNRPQDHMLARKLLVQARLPTVHEVRDEAFDPRTLLDAIGATTTTHTRQRAMR
jgi:3-phenylpropionate/trans-cinnamate dioxygenase ferredoxin reductase subunit